MLMLACAVAACRTTAPTSAGNGSGAAAGGTERAPIIQPGAPGHEGHAVDTRTMPQVTYTAADVTFMQGMIGHHSQAVEMTDLLATHTASEDMKKLGLRISLSQQDEIKMMTHWLQARGQTVPASHAMMMGHEHMEGMDMGTPMLMPGMLTPEEMARLAAAKGPEFDRLFLEGMIKHHGGALYMVQELLKTPGAAQDPDIFAFVSDVDSDQRMEIDRMSAMLKELQK